MIYFNSTAPAPHVRQRRLCSTTLAAHRASGRRRMDLETDAGTYRSRAAGPGARGAAPGSRRGAGRGPGARSGPRGAAGRPRAKSEYRTSRPADDVDQLT